MGLVYYCGFTQKYALEISLEDAELDEKIRQRFKMQLHRASLEDIPIFASAGFSPETIKLFSTYYLWPGNILAQTAMMCQGLAAAKNKLSIKLS